MRYEDDVLNLLFKNNPDISFFCNQRCSISTTVKVMQSIQLYLLLKKISKFLVSHSLDQIYIYIFFKCFKFIFKQQRKMLSFS